MAEQVPDVIRLAPTRGPHLERKGRLCLDGHGPIALVGETLVVGGRWGKKGIRLVDVADPETPTLLATVPCRESVNGVLVHPKRPDLVICAESTRGLLFVDVTDPTSPRIIDCAVSLGVSLRSASVLSGGRYVAAGLNWGGVGLFDIEDMARARLVDRQKLDEGFVERLTSVGDVIFAAGASGGLRLFKVEGGRLVEVARPRPEVNTSRVFAFGDRVWCFGSSGDEGQVAFEVDVEGAVTHAMSFDAHTPDALDPSSGGSFGGTYTASFFDLKRGFAADVFQMYNSDREEGGPVDYVEIPRDMENWTDEARAEIWDRPMACMEEVRALARRGELLYACHTDELGVYRVVDGSVFEARSD